MSAESDLHTLLAGISPSLKHKTYVFAVVEPAAAAELAETAVARFREAEGVTLILPRDEAERLGLSWIFPCRTITLEIHSALEAVGLVAAVAARLSEAGICANVVSAYYHDHLFIPEDRAEEALALLRVMATEDRRTAMEGPRPAAVEAQ